MHMILQKIESLPPLPQTIQKMEQLFAQTDTPDPKEVTRIVQTDPLFSAQILARANSAFYSFRQKIATLEKAISLIGPLEVKNLLYDILLKQTFEIDLSPYNVTPKEFSHTAIFRSRYFHKIAKKIGLENIAPYSTLIFLLDVGKILIAQEIIALKKTRAFQQDLRDFPEESSVEILHLNITTLEVDLYLFNKWNFDMELLQTLRSVIQGKLVDDYAKLTALCYKTFSLSKGTLQHPQYLFQLAKEVHLDPQLLHPL